MTEAIAAYLDEKRRRGRPDGKPIRESTITTLRYRLDAIHAPISKVDQLRPAKCAELYETRRNTWMVPPPAVNAYTVRADTHRNELAVAKAFGAWLGERGWTKGNPWEAVEPMGGLSRGKEQLRVDEARRFSDVAFEMCDAGDVAAIAVTTALILGLRASEVLLRVVRDVDDGGKLLWIPDAKTEAGKRREEIPLALQPYIARLVAGRASTDALFPRLSLARRRGRALDVVTNDWLRYHTTRLCKAAGVPRVCPHSLRGLHSTLAVEAGATPHLVAASLGHADRGGTAKRHYIAPGTLERASTRRVAGVLGRSGVGNDSEPIPSPSPIDPITAPAKSS